MISDTEYFSHLYEIASALNREFSLHTALKKALERTVDLFELETGWIWLLQAEKSVYLAASYNLPPALRDHPERLSGWCYCIEKYLSNNLDTARNVSEIVCSRLKNIKSGTNDLKFHATIPINIADHKVGMINLLSRESQELTAKQLSVLNTIGELIGIAVQRTQVQDSYAQTSHRNANPVEDVLKRVFIPQLKIVVQSIERAELILANADSRGAAAELRTALQSGKQLQNRLLQVVEETDVPASDLPPAKVHFPASALTRRELELLALVKKGHTNKQIAEVLFIAERTVKFHITSLFSKLNAKTRTEAVNIAIQRGLIGF